MTDPNAPTDLAPTAPIPELVRLLLEPGTYPDSERPVTVRLVETHISWLFFAGPFVYKVKKPVNLGFLDFTSLEQRRFFCLEELRLNRRLSPDVYLGVVEIWEEGGRYAMHQGGRIIEYAVKMRRLPGDRWLSGLLKRGEATGALMRRIAQRIAAFHATADSPGRRIGGIDTVRVNTQENFTQARDQIGLTIGQEAYDRVNAFTEAYLDTRAGLFEQREREGRVRDCHGDLHADQICVENGIAFIDCIEFNERFRYSDVAADVAFPVMDIDYHGRPDLAEELVREYVAASRDAGAMALLDFYKCYRAFTRGKVRGFRLRQGRLAAGDRGVVIEQSSRYFALANQYAQLPGPLLVVIGGLMGTGKSSLAASLGVRLGAVVLASDLVRKELAGISPEEHRLERWEEGIYATAFTGRTYDELHRRAGERLRQGTLVILDASYRRTAWRAQARETARANGAPCLFVEAVCPDAVVRSRLAGRTSGASDGRLELLDRQREEFEAPLEIPTAERVRIDTAGPLENVATEALATVYRWRLALASPVRRTPASSHFTEL